MSQDNSPVGKLVAVLKPVLDEQTNKLREHSTAQHQELLIKMGELENRVNLLSNLLTNTKPKKLPKKAVVEERPGQFDVEFD
jgi:hypothetical protein